MGAARKACTGRGFKGFMGVYDLNCERPICDALGSDRPEVTHERRQDAVRAGDGIRAVEDRWTHRRPASGRCGRAHIGLCRCLPHHGFCATHVARVAARHRGLLGRQSRPAVSHGAEGPAGACDAGRCPQPARVAHLSCPDAAADRPRPRPLCPRAVGGRPRRQRLCVGFHDHRSVPEVCSTGRRFD